MERGKIVSLEDSKKYYWRVADLRVTKVTLDGRVYTDGTRGYVYRDINKQWWFDVVHTFENPIKIVITDVFMF
jgi:hypothetical protein